MAVDRQSSVARPYGLLAWIAVACLGFALAPAPPEPPATTPEEQAVRVRMVDWAVQDAQRWQAERGDLVIPWEQACGHLAIVVDDIGRELHVHERLQDLRFQLTFSVLPGAVYAPGAQLRLRTDPRRYREIMLHLPMEPLDAEQMRRPEDAKEIFLRQIDAPETLRKKLADALARVPTAVGVNNHMGSRLTSDPAAMRVIMEELRARGLFFLDSKTSASSCAHDVAQLHDIPSVARDIFLDHDARPHAISAALERASALACERPTVVIAHPSRAFAETLRDTLPRLHDNRIGIYPVSDVLAHRGYSATADAMDSGKRERNGCAQVLAEPAP